MQVPPGERSGGSGWIRYGGDELAEVEGVSRIGDSASVHAVARVNAEQALYEAFEVKHYLTAFSSSFFPVLCSTWNFVTTTSCTRMSAVSIPNSITRAKRRALRVVHRVRQMDGEPCG